MLNLHIIIACLDGAILMSTHNTKVHDKIKKKSLNYLNLTTVDSLSRPRLSRIIAYLEAIIWSLLKHKNLTTANKILWKRGEIAPKEQFLLFRNIFNISLTSGVKLHMHLLDVAVRFIFS